MATQSILRPPALAGIGPGLLASLIIAAAAAFLADHYGGPVMFSIRARHSRGLLE